MLRVIVLDQGNGTFIVRAAGRAFKGKLGDSCRWKTAEFEVDPGGFTADRDNAHIVIIGETGLTLHMIEVAR